MPAGHPSKELRLDDLTPDQLMFRNFEGRERFGSEERNFNIKLDPETAKKLIKDEWRVRQGKPYGENEEGDYLLKVKVNYKKGRPPRCVVISAAGAVEWGEDEIGLLDSADIEKFDVLISGWWSDMAGGGYGGYLRSIYVTLHVDALALKYADVLNQNPNERGELSPDEYEEE